jgi:hypothetical protein
MKTMLYGRFGGVRLWVNASSGIFYKHIAAAARITYQ